MAKYGGSGGAQVPRAKPRPHQGPRGSTGNDKGHTPGEGHKAHPLRPVKGGVKKRAIRRLETLGGVQGVSRKGGITRREAKKVRRRWVREGMPKPGGRPRPQPQSVIDPLTPKTMRREVRAAQDVRYGPELRNLSQQIRGSDYRSNTEIPQWFQGFLNTQQQAAQNAQGMWQGAQQGIGQVSAQQEAGVNQDLNAHLAQASQAAQVSGDQAQMQPFANAYAAQGARQQQAIGEAGYVGAQGGVNASHMASQQVVGAQKMLEALQREGRVKGALQEQRRGVVAERGQFGVDQRRELRGDEREWAAIMKEFGLKETDLAIEEAENRREAQQKKKDRKQDRLDRRQREKAARRTSDRLKMQDDRKFKLDQRKFGEDVAQDRYQRRHGLSEYKPSDSDGSGGSKGPGGSSTNVPPSERRSNQRRFRSLTRYARSGEAPPGTVDPLMKKGVEEWVRNKKKGVSGKTARQLWRNYGIKVPVAPHRTGRPIGRENKRRGGISF